MGWDDDVGLQGSRGASIVSSGMFSLDIGILHCTVVYDSTMHIDPALLFPRQQQSLWPQMKLDASGRVEICVNCLVVESSDHRLIIDAGNGHRSGRQADENGKLASSLSKLGADPTEIDIAVLTHAHVDHVAGLIGVSDGGAPRVVYPDARHIVPLADWEFTMHPPKELDPNGPLVKGAPARQEALRAVERAGLLDLVEPDAEVVPGIKMIHAPGHTPGHSAVVLESNGQMLVFLADAFHHPIQIEHPSLVSEVTDYPRDLVPSTRRSLVKYVVEQDALALGTHFRFPGIGRIEGPSDTPRFVEMSQSELSLRCNKGVGK